MNVTETQPVNADRTLNAFPVPTVPGFVGFAGPVIWQQVYALAFARSREALRDLWIAQHQPGMN